MSLNYPPKWKFDSNIPNITFKVINDLYDLVKKIASGNKNIVEVFKRHYDKQYPSTQYTWALTDLREAMEDFADKPVMFIDNYWSALQDLEKDGIAVPPAQNINKILSDGNIRFRIEPPELTIFDDSIITDSNITHLEGNDEQTKTIYEIQEQVGNGAFGMVYRVTKATSVTMFDFAMKILDISPFIEDLETAKKRFSREIGAIVSLNHKAIVSYVDAGLTHDNKQFIIMPLIEGKDLLTTCQNLPYVTRIHLFIEFLNGLNYAHKNGIIHRDLKPSNIIVRDSDLQPIILDFGCTYIMEEAYEESLTKDVVGSIGYIAPEVVANPKVRSFKQDIYACGVILYQLLSGILPNHQQYESLTHHDKELEVFDGVIQSSIAAADERTEDVATLITKIRLALDEYRELKDSNDKEQI